MHLEKLLKAVNIYMIRAHSWKQLRLPVLSTNITQKLHTRLSQFRQSFPR